MAPITSGSNAMNDSSVKWPGSPRVVARARQVNATKILTFNAIADANNLERGPKSPPRASADPVAVHAANMDCPLTRWP